MVSASSTYYYRAKVVNEAGRLKGIRFPLFHYWELNDAGSITIDEKGINGEILVHISLDKQREGFEL